MQRNFSIKRFGGFFLACLLMMSPYLFAENDSEANEEIKKENKSYFKEEKIKILKNMKELIINPTQRTPQPSKKVDKLNVILKSIAGNEKDRYAVVEFEGEELTIRKDLVVKGKFKVIDIYPDRMVVYSFGEQRRHTYKITENEKINTTQKTTQPLRKVELLKVIVKSIAGNEEDRYAVVEFEGEEITIRKDQIVKGKFKVVNIYPDRVVVFSRSEQRPHTYKITEEKEINTTQKTTQPLNKDNSRENPYYQRQFDIVPLEIIVKSIVIKEDDCYAAIEFEGEEMVVRKDQIVKEKFKVIDIFSDRIVVYPRAEQRRRTYRISKDSL